jgi:cellulose synthase/poly-beta-1,6-N-acetylglucosamine synthase-like glycosyltransferase
VTAAIWSPDWFASAAIICFGTLAAAAGVYLLILAIAAFAYRESQVRAEPTSRLVVLVPAHNEQDLIGRCIASLKSQDYRLDRFRTFVIADNCTDETEALARAAGADVLVRDVPEARGKGQALRWAMDQLVTSAVPPDAFVVVDADSVADRGLLRGLASHLESGAEAVQAEYLVLADEASPRVQLRAVAFLLFHRVRFAGRAALHLPCSLVGNGMLLSRTMIERHPWNAFSGAEDLEYSVTLRVGGVRPVFAGSALVRGPVPASRRSAQVQRERWEGGRLYVARTALPRLLRAIVIDRRVSVVDAAVDLVVPPLGLLAAGVLAGVVLVLGLWGAGFVSLWILTPWLIALAAIAGFVTVGLRSAKAPAWMYRRLVSAPAFLVQKLLGTVGVVRGRAADRWIRTERPGEIVP